MTDEDRLVADRYRLVERVGAGATGTVWRAADERLRRTVALRQLVTATEADGTREPLLRAARAVARLHHPNVVLVFDIVEHGGCPWLVLEYLPSRTLATALRTGPLPRDEVSRIGAQAAAGLAAAHAIDVLHRDVRPGNVLLRDDGIVKVADFGIRLDPLTGTPGYLAPELAAGVPLGRSADVFALGATLYAALTGAPPAGGRFRTREPLAGLLGELLRPDPADRPTMPEAHTALAALASAGDPLLTDPTRAWTAPVDDGGESRHDPGPPTVGVRLPAFRLRLLRLAVALAGYRAWPVVRSALPIRCR